MMDRSARPLAQSLRCARYSLPIRTFSTTRVSPLDVETSTSPASEPPPPPPMTNSNPGKRRDPKRVSNPRHERQLIRNQGILPIGSRRRRAALATSPNIQFHLLPYQCFQEARAFLQEDRQEKREQIQLYRSRIERLQAIDVAPQDEAMKQKRLADMRRKLEATKILADINDPIVKRRFEDGVGDMNKPIYRHLADKQWRAYKRRLLMQRITQMNVVPDVLPAIDPVVSTTLSWPKYTKKIQHGDFVSSLVSEQPPVLKIQPFDKGERLYTIAVINADVPDVQKDGFTYRCHFLASNIMVSPTNTVVPFSSLSETTQVILPWLPAYSQKGIEYQRMSIFVLEQPKSDTVGSQTLDVASIKTLGRYTKRDEFILRSFADKYSLTPVGVDLFRTRWDEGTAGVMQRAGIVGWDVEFKRKRVEPLPYKRKDGARYR